MDLYVDNILVINAWQDGGVREVTGDRTLNAGTHTVRVEYYERTGEARIRVWWEKVTASYTASTPRMASSTNWKSGSNSTTPVRA